MLFSNILGQTHIKNHLLKSIENGRIPHAQLFVGKTGSGLLPMALAYAQAILSSNHAVGSKGYENCMAKVANLAHPDLHFVFPVNTNEKVKKNPFSALFMEDWRAFVSENKYSSLYDWLAYLGIEKKQGNINVDEAKQMLKTLSLKAYEGGHKIMIIWMADRMNTACANKILKLVEEPPQKTVLLLLTEHEEHILGTIQSRCQKLQFPLLPENVISSQLIENKGVEDKKAKKISSLSNGDYHQALNLLNNLGDDAVFENWFVDWVRTAFKAKGNKDSINALILWSEEIAKQGRETQKKFLGYCQETFRQALLKNYKADSLLFFDTPNTKFSIEKFAPFVHQNNIFEISEALETASYHIERNGNAKIIFTDLSIKLTRLLHAKA
ncbi:DNA polymerase III subunit delta' [Flavobacteriaceae bacterium]|nr:DNA polymerase III subunit delta' [Flavobacteriaceae bacterium]MDB9964918.1 DNA polymerase III subunit delta' [Flavobacteriaceae bacterium]